MPLMKSGRPLKRWRWIGVFGPEQMLCVGDARVAGNLVDGVHDAPQASERTVWVEREPREAGPVEFAPDLSSVGGLEFSAWSTREHRTRRGPFRSDYRQPFGSFRGELPGGLEL